MLSHQSISHLFIILSDLKSVGNFFDFFLPSHTRKFHLAEALFANHISGKNYQSTSCVSFQPKNEANPLQLSIPCFFDGIQCSPVDLKFRNKNGFVRPYPNFIASLYLFHDQVLTQCTSAFELYQRFV